MPTISLSDLRAKALARVDGNSALYTNAEIDFVVNECLRTVFLFTGYYRLTVDVPGLSVANKLVYSTPAGILIPSVVAFDGRQIQKLSLKALARTRRTWATDTTASRGQVDYWAPVGNGQFVISPKDSTGGRAISVTGLGEPPLLVQPTDVMSLENEYVELLTEYCAHRLPLKEGGKIFADGSLALNTFYSKLRERGILEKAKLPRYYLLGPKPKQEDAA